MICSKFQSRGTIYVNGKKRKKIQNYYTLTINTWQNIMSECIRAGRRQKITSWHGWQIVSYKRERLKFCDLYILDSIRKPYLKT